MAPRSPENHMINIIFWKENNMKKNEIQANRSVVIYEPIVENLVLERYEKISLYSKKRDWKLHFPKKYIFHFLLRYLVLTAGHFSDQIVTQKRTVNRDRASYLRDLMLSESVAKHGQGKDVQSPANENKEAAPDDQGDLKAVGEAENGQAQVGKDAGLADERHRPHRLLHRYLGDYGWKKEEKKYFKIVLKNEQLKNVDLQFIAITTEDSINQLNIRGILNLICRRPCN